MQTLILKEYDNRSVHARLDMGQRAALAKAHIEVAAPTDDQHTWTLRPSSYIGAVRAGGLSIIVRPKILIDRVMFLVAYALNPKEWRQYSFDLHPSPDVLESIIPAFTYHTHQAIRRGLLQGYRREEEALHTVRGRIRFNEQVKRRFDIPLPIEVAYNEFTQDIEENRLLKTALHRLAHLPARSEQVRRSVLALRPAFNTVALGMYRRGAPEVQYTRLNAHYRPAVELARLIIDNSSLELFHGDVSGASFLLDMNKVFEEFLYVALREALGLPESQWRQGAGLTLDEGHLIRMNPDLSWWPSGPAKNGSRPIFVGDAKYKKIEPKGFEHADIYQMLAYCTAARLPSGLLVYASGEGEPGVYKINHAGKTIEVAWLDLKGTPEAILDAVHRLAHRVEAHTHLLSALRSA